MYIKLCILFITSISAYRIGTIDYNTNIKVFKRKRSNKLFIGYYVTFRLKARPIPLVYFKPTRILQSCSYESQRNTAYILIKVL